MSELTTTPNESQTTAINDFLARPLLAAINLDWEKAIYITFFLIAIVSRFVFLGDRVMSHDESLHTQFSYQFYNGDGYQHTPLMHGPSLFHATAVSYWLFGDSDLSARIPVAILGVLLVVLMPYLLRPWLGKIGALFTSFFLLISPYITYYSRYIRHDIYVIMAALVVFLSIWYYFGARRDKYIWWFAIGLGLMFTTMETAFIYVAIFGSFAVVRLLPQMVVADWFRASLGRLRLPILLVMLAVLLAGGGLLGQKLIAEAPLPLAEATATLEGFAADPDAVVGATAVTPLRNEMIWRWSQIIGLVILGVGAFMAARALRPELDQYPEFDIIMLFSTLVLPLVSPLLTKIAGWNPTDYAINKCVLESQETMTAVQLLIARLGNGDCWSSFFQSGLVRSGYFLIPTLIIGVLVGLWWDRRRWLTAAFIFYGIFIVLFTSVFTNPGGFATGIIGSLGYWLDQQAVQRGSQPLFYYLFVTPFYEFLLVIFSFAGIWLWHQQHRLQRILGYWLALLLAAFLGYSLSTWLYTRSLTAGGLLVMNGDGRNTLLGMIVALVILGAGSLFWLFVYRHRLAQQNNLEGGLASLFSPRLIMEFVPSVAWWLMLTWVAYSVAGEKMPWLSTHFVIPMAILSGWYFGEKLRTVDVRALFARPSLIFGGLSLLLLVVGFGLFSQLWLGSARLGDQQISALQDLGLFLGLLLLAGVVFYFWQRYRQGIEPTTRRLILTLSVFILLSLLTIRFTYLASFPNADYTTEYMVYAHGAPATKRIVMDQIEELSMRLHGDQSIKVAYDNDVSWPFTWYLRNYPNRVYFGENPSNSLNESPIIIAGSQNWGKVEPYLGNNYEQRTYTFLWWPMEEYRKISWNAIFGNPNDLERRGLGNANVRQALWDVFFYRDYEKYGQTFGGAYTSREWPLRQEMRVYIRKDVLANLWDYGVGAVNAASLQDPYAENELQLAPSLILNDVGLPGVGDGELTTPRNVTVGPDGRIYVVDSGNHRLQVFDAQGNFLAAWGEFGAEPGQFNEPWSVAVDDEFVYVADTWNYRIQKFTTTGEFVAAYGRNGSPADINDRALGLFYGPRDILLLDDGRLLITDTGNHRLQIMDRDGNFVDSMGQFGSQPGWFNEPVGLANGPEDSVYVADTWNGRIQQFTADLFPAFQWSVNAWYSQSIDNKPYIATDSAGRIYVTDPEGYRVLIFNAFGDYMGRFGSFGTGPTQFALPVGIATDAQDNIYIADAHNNRIVKYPPPFGSPVLPEQQE
ncbi:MAG: TIGR03663 family protein [Chloroflexi bacterium]|nr:TIGR03663 family protein [Chloroflexota bacterium]